MWMAVPASVSKGRLIQTLVRSTALRQCSRSAQAVSCLLSPASCLLWAHDHEVRDRRVSRFQL